MTGDHLRNLADARGISLDIYEPAEDSALIAAACVEEIEPTEQVLDVGTGTGFVAARIHKETGADVTGIDINPIACQRAQQADIPTICGDLTTAIADNSIDVLVSNPPYLPTSPFDRRPEWLSTALDGGPTGRAIIDRIIADLDRILSRNGRAYLLVSSLIDPSVIESEAREQGFTVSTIKQDDSFPFETLSVLRLDRH